MFRLDDPFPEYMDQDTAVMQVLEQTDRGLFDTEYEPDEDLAALSEPVRRAPAKRRSPT